MRRVFLILVSVVFLWFNSAFGATVDEVKMGDNIAKEVEKEFPLVKNPVEVSRVESVGYSLARHSSRKDIDYKFKVIAKKDINAFSIPGGYIYVFSGMLNFVRTDSELAAVIAHEIAHIEYRHALKQVAAAQRMTVYSLAVALLTRTTAGVLLPNLIQTAVLNKYSREYEEEADLRSIELLLKAGYNPVSALTIIERLYALSLTKPPRDYGIMMSHPELKDRAVYIHKCLKDKGIEIDRRKAANYVPIKVGEDGLSVYAEDVLLYKASSKEEASDFASKLDKAFKVDLEPFQIRVEEGKLTVDGILIKKGSDEELRAVKDKLVKILLDFRIKYMPF
ncbi:MAG: M48 family metalloprotease [Synergistetes bacterium]|nr:M48 family metalloprotease [Synergistota bacterium]MCX8128195.1 M48 family metalloprotease [Synergistota bacterium]MDW8192571.1 M48 family metalloprotease [Synergistota bacterium]